MCVVVQKQWQQRKYALGSSGPDSSYQNTKAFAYTCTNAKKIWVYVWQARAGCGDTKKNDSWSKVSNVNYFMDFDLRVSMRGAHMWDAILTITFPYSIAYASNVYSILCIQSFALHRLSIRSAIQFLFFSLYFFIIVYFLFAAIFAQLISSLLHKHLANIRNTNWFLPFSCESLTFEFVSMSSFASFPCTIRITSFFSRCFSLSIPLSVCVSVSRSRY